MTTPLEDPLLKDAPVSEGFKILEPCVIYAKIGAGGMGAVYRASHVNFNRDVAVKVLRPELAAAEDTFVKRFRKEAAMAATVTHQNLVQVFEVNFRHGIHYIVMEFVQGENVRDRVHRKGPLNLGEACAIVRDAARGLALAHRKGIVHRDVKPDNILISRDGEVKVADLGLAKATDSEDALTSTRMMMGTPQYTPPEQWEDARTAGPPADVWALGATLWFLVAGRSAIEKGAPMSVGFRIVNGEFPDLRSVVPDAPEGLYALIDRCTQKAPADRFADAGAFLVELERFIEGDLKGAPDLADFEAGRRAGLTAISPPPAFTLDEVRTSMTSSTVPLTPEPEPYQRAKTPDPTPRPQPKPAPDPASEPRKTALRTEPRPAPRKPSPGATGVSLRSRAPVIAIGALVAVGAAFGVWKWLDASADDVPYRAPAGFDERAAALPALESLLPRDAVLVVRAENTARAARLDEALFPLTEERLWKGDILNDLPVPVDPASPFASVATYEGTRTPVTTFIVKLKAGASVSGVEDVRATAGSWAAVSPSDAYVRGEDPALAADLPAGDVAFRMAAQPMLRPIRREIERDLEQILEASDTGSRNDPSMRPLVAPAIAMVRGLMDSATHAEGAIENGKAGVTARVQIDLADGSAAARDPWLSSGRFDDIARGVPTDHPVVVCWTADPARVAAPIITVIDDALSKVPTGPRVPMAAMATRLKLLLRDHGTDAVWSAGAPNKAIQVVRIARHGDAEDWVGRFIDALDATVPPLMGDKLKRSTMDVDGVTVHVRDVGFDLDHMERLAGHSASKAAQERTNEEMTEIFGRPAVPIRVAAVAGVTVLILGDEALATDVVRRLQDDSTRLVPGLQKAIDDAGSGPSVVVYTDLVPALRHFARIANEPMLAPPPVLATRAPVSLFLRQDDRVLRGGAHVTHAALKVLEHLKK